MVKDPPKKKSINDFLEAAPQESTSQGAAASKGGKSINEFLEDDPDPSFRQAQPAGPTVGQEGPGPSSGTPPVVPSTAQGISQDASQPPSQGVTAQGRTPFKGLEEAPDRTPELIATAAIEAQPKATRPSDGPKPLTEQERASRQRSLDAYRNDFTPGVVEEKRRIKAELDLDDDMRKRPERYGLSEEKKNRAYDRFSAMDLPMIEEFRSKVVPQDLSVIKSAEHALKSDLSELEKSAAQIEQLELQAGALGTPEAHQEYVAEVDRHNANVKFIQRQQAQLKDMADAVMEDGKQALLREQEIKSGQGTWMGAAWNGMLKNMGAAVSGWNSAFLMEPIMAIDPPPVQPGETPEEAKARVRKDLRAGMRTALKDIAGTEGTTEEYEQALGDRSLLGSALVSVVGTVPLMFMGPGGLGMMTQAADNTMEEMEGEEFANIPEWKRQLFADGLGAIVGSLEKAGVRQALTGGKMAREILAKAIEKSPANASAAELKKFLAAETSSAIANMSARVLGASASEGATELMQGVSEYGLKEIFNAAEEKNLLPDKRPGAEKGFETPDGITEYVKDVGKQVLVGAIAGAIMRGPAEVHGLMKSASLGKKMTDSDFSALEGLLKDPGIEEITARSMDEDVERGKMSEGEAKAAKLSWSEAKKIVTSIPETLPVESRKEAFDLLTEKARLSKMDKSLIGDRILKIDEKLAALEGVPETPEPTVTKEGEKTEPKSVQPTGEEVVEVSSLPAEEPITPTTQEDAGVDIGDPKYGKSDNKIPSLDEVYDEIDSEEGAQGGRLVGEDGRFETEDQALGYAKEIMDVLTGTIENGHVPVYRVVQADEVSLDPYGIGDSWSQDIEAAKQFARQNLGGKNIKIISGYAPVGSIDWKQAVRNYLNFSDIGSGDSEFELPIPGGNPIKSVRVVDAAKAKPLPPFAQPTQAVDEPTATKGADSSITSDEVVPKGGIAPSGASAQAAPPTDTGEATSVPVEERVAEPKQKPVKEEGVVTERLFSIPETGEKVDVSKDAAVIAALPEYNRTKAELEKLGPEPPKPSAEAKYFGRAGKEGASPEAVKRYDDAKRAYSKWRAKYSKLKTAEVEASNKLFRAEKAAAEMLLAAPKEAATATGKAPEGKKKEAPAAPKVAEAKKPISDKAKVIADKLRQGKLGGKGVKSSIPGFEQAWDAAIEAAAIAVEAGGDVAQVISDAIKALKNSDWYKGATKDERETREKEVSDFVSDSVQESAAKPKDPKKVKKTFTTVRAYEGEFREEVKEKLENSGLYREVENQEEAQKRATEFVKEVGIEAALDAVDAGDVQGAARTFIRVAAIEDTQRQIDKADNQEEIERLELIQADLIQKMSAAFTSGGQEAAALNRIYATSDLGFYSAKKAEEWESEFGEKPSDEMMAEWKKRDEELKSLRKQLDEALQRAQEAEENAAVEAIKQAAARQKAKPRTYARKAKDLADQFRRLKGSPMTFVDADGNVIEVKEMGGGWNELVEIGAKVIEKTGQLVDGIAAIAEYLRNQGWFASLDDRNKAAVMQQIEDHFRSINEEDTDGRIRIPKRMIREAVEAGANDIKTLVAVIKEQIREEYPDATDREIRDAITEYGKVVNMGQDEVSASIRRMKDIGRTISAIEDVENKKRPLRSGLQRDKLDAEQRALKKKLRELMKGLPLDAATQERELRTALDAAKSRTQNRIEDMEREIEMRERVRKSNRVLTPDAELDALIERKNELQKQHDAIFKDKSLTQEERLDRAIDAARRSLEGIRKRIADRDLSPKKQAPIAPNKELSSLREQLEVARVEFNRLQEEAGIIEKKRLDMAKAATQNRIDDLRRRIEEKDFAPQKKRDPVVQDSELIALKAQQMRVRERYDKDFYKHKFANRTTGERIADGVWQAWGLTRALQATGEFSFVLIQGGALTTSNMWHKPAAVGRAVRNMWSAFWSESKSEQWLANIKAQDWYPQAKKAKLALTEPHAELSAREELFFSDWTKAIWSGFGSPLFLISPKAYLRWVTANPFRAIERGAVAYLDTLRIERYADGIKMLEKQGKTPSDKDLKDIADVANTLTGRASLGKAELISEGLTKIFFSPRLWSSAIKTATPYGLWHFGKMTPTARKMAMQDMGRFVGTTMTFVAMAAFYLNGDDDEETGVETDPRSTDFLKIKIGDTRIDPWGGRIQQVVFTTKLVLGAMSLFRDEPLMAHKNTKTGELHPLGVPYKSPTLRDVALQMATNKLAPSASLLAEAADTKLRKKDGEMVRTNTFGEEFVLSDKAKEKLVPIYWETISELSREDPGALEGFLLLYAFLGGGVQTYENKGKSKSKGSGKSDADEQKSIMDALRKDLSK